MSVAPPTENPRRKRLRRRFILLLIPVLLFAITWKAAEAYIDIEYYRPIIDQELELLIELPLAFGAMDLQLLPTPRLVVSNVALGEDSFMAFSPEVTVTADLGKLIRKQLELKVVSIHNLRVQLPEQTPDLQQRWSDYMKALETPDAVSGTPLLKVTLEEIVAEGAQVFRGNTHYATGDLTVSHVTTDAPVFSFSAEGAGITGTPAASGAFTLTVDRDPLLQGSATVSRLPLANLTGDYAIPPFILDGDLEYAHSHGGAWQFSAEGGVRIAGDTDALGTYSLAAHHGGEGLQFERLEIDSNPINFKGNLGIFADGRWSLSIEEAILRDSGIAWLVARVPEIPFLDNATTRSEGMLTNMRLGDEAGTGFAIAAGTLAVQGVDLNLGASILLPDIHGQATFTEGTIDIAALTSRHLDLAGRLQTNFSANTLTLDLAGRGHLLPDLPLPAALAGTIRPDAGTIDLRALHASFQAGVVHFPTLRLDASIQEATLALWDAGSAAFLPIPGIAGNITAADGTLRLTDLKSTCSAGAVSLTPDEGLARWDFAIDFTSAMTSPIWTALIPGTTLTPKRGTITCPSLTGTLAAGSFTPEALALEATIQDFQAELHGPGFQELLTLDTVRITADTTHATLAMAGAADRFGPLEGNARIAFETGDANGTLTLSPARMRSLPDAFQEGPGSALLARISPLPLDLHYTGASSLLQFSANAPIALDGTVSHSVPDGARAPVAIKATATVPAAWLASYAARGKASGNVAFQGELNPQDGRISVQADATEAAWTWSLLHKIPGTAATLQLAGHWNTGEPSLASGTLAVAGQQVPFTLGADGIASDGFDIDLAALNPILPEGATVSGTARGSFAQDMNVLALDLGDATFTPGPERPVLAANGPIRREPEGWSSTNLAWSVGASNGSARLWQDASGWTGAVEARHLDLDEVASARSAIATLSKSADVAPDDRAWPVAAISVEAATLAWVVATVERAHMTLKSDGGTLTLRDVTFAHGTGTGAGGLVYRIGRDGHPDSVEAEVELREVNADLIEGLFMGETRDLDGLLNGTARLAFPVPADGSSLLNGMNGSIQFDAVNGTLGKAGLASKLLTALRTTDILRLRIPQLRDRGLTFNALSGKIEIQQGVFHLTPLALTETTYLLEADARFDFPQDTAEGDVAIQVLEGVTGVARKIPILGGAAGLISKALGVPIKISGKATDPSFRVGMPG